MATMCSSEIAPTYEQTVSFTDPGPNGDFGVLWGIVNGVPIYMPWGTRAVIFPQVWLDAHPPKRAEGLPTEEAK